MDLLDDATALHLEAAQEALRQIVRDIAEGSGVVVRKRGGWQVRREQRGVWRHLSLGDLAKLPDVRIRMQAEWGFDSREALLAFLRTAGRLDSGDWLSDWVVFDAVSFRIQQPIQVFQAAAPVQLASQVLRLVMQSGAFVVRLDLVDTTPFQGPPTIHLRLFAKDENEASEERQDLVGLQACTPEDPTYLSSGNSRLAPKVWRRFLDDTEPRPLPLLFGVCVL